MSDAILTLPPDGTGGQKVDVEQLTVGANTVIRHRTVVAGSGSTEIVRAMGSSPAGTEVGLVVRPILRSSTGATPINVLASITSVAVLSSNAARVGATITNDSTAILYLGFGVTPTVSSWGAKLFAGGYYEVPYGFTGAINGIWDAADGGHARGQEIS